MNNFEYQYHYKSMVLSFFQLQQVEQTDEDKNNKNNLNYNKIKSS